MLLINLLIPLCDFFGGENNNRSSIIALKYFPFSKQSNIMLIYDCQIDGDIFNPISILSDLNIKHYHNMVRFHSNFLSFPKALENGMHALYLKLIIPHI